MIYILLILKENLHTLLKYAIMKKYSALLQNSNILVAIVCHSGACLIAFNEPYFDGNYADAYWGNNLNKLYRPLYYMTSINRCTSVEYCILVTF